LAGIRISQVYHALVGKEPRRTGSTTFRAAAIWRDGDGLNVSLNDARGVWHDFTANEGGGVLDLVIRIRGGTRQDALRWTADFAGFSLDDRPLSATESAHWARQRRQVELELPKARLWRRAAVALSEQVLEGLKAALTDPKLPRPEIGEIAYWTTQLTSWRRLDGAALVAEYLWWAEHQPRLTGGMIFDSTMRETTERRALCAFLRMTDPADAA
jgi:hypothetical protein